MARGQNSATASDTTEGANATDTGANATDTKKARANRSYVVVPMPGDLKARFEAEAKNADMPVGPYVLREVIAKQLGIEIPITVTARRSKYGSDEERKAAQKARNQNRSATMRDLMAAFRKATSEGKTPEEAAAIASQAMVKLMTEGPSRPAATDEASTEPAQTEGQPVTA